MQKPCELPKKLEAKYLTPTIVHKKKVTKKVSFLSRLYSQQFWKNYF